MSRLVASPSTRAYARQRGVDLEALSLEIQRESIAREDVDRKIAGKAAAAVSALGDLWEVDHAQFGPVRVEPLSRLMQVAAANLTVAQRMIPSVTNHDRAPMDAIEALRTRLRPDAERNSVKLTALAFHVIALGRCLRDHPRFNASLTPDGGSLVLKDYVHIGIAVDTHEGLVVPVVRNADTKGLWQIASEISHLAALAKARKLRSDHMRGASMSITNLGGIGGSGFSPIINPPELAILGISRAETVPVWEHNAFVPKLMAPLDLTYDHRAINGADAARFLRHYGSLLADPRMLLL